MEVMNDSLAWRDAGPGRHHRQPGQGERAAAAGAAGRRRLAQRAGRPGRPGRGPADRPGRGRKKDPEWAARRRLLLGYQRDNTEALTRIWNALIEAGEPGLEILHAYIVKEQLRRLLALPTTADRELISHRLWQFYTQAAASDIPEAHRLAETIEAWWPAVEAAITTGYSNARSEGYNRLAKHVGRDAFGFRNPVNQRRRIRWSCTRPHRRLSASNIMLPG